MAGRQGLHPRPIRSVIVPIGPSIAYVPLTCGQFALIDSDDAAELGQWNWYARSSPSGFYARRKEGPQFVVMHRHLIGPSDGMYVDHKNGRTLDNRVTNLREATPRQNQQNQGKNRKNKSGYKGVSWDVRKQNFVSQIRHEGKSIKLWRGQDPQAGHAIYCEAATRLHGEFARTA